MSSGVLEEIIERVVRRVVAEVLPKAPTAGAADVKRGDVLSQTEAAALAGVSPATIRDWQDKDYLPKGYRGRVERAALLKFLAEGVPSKVNQEDADAKAVAILTRRAGGQRRG